MSEKKKFKDTKVGGWLVRDGKKILGEIIGGVLDVIPLPTGKLSNYIREKLDKDNDGKVSFNDFGILQIAAGASLLSLMLYWGIIDIDQLLTLIESLKP